MYLIFLFFAFYLGGQKKKNLTERHALSNAFYTTWSTKHGKHYTVTVTLTQQITSLFTQEPQHVFLHKAADALEKIHKVTNHRVRL